MTSMTVGKRLGLGFGAVIILMIVVAVLGIMNMRTLQHDVDTLINDKFPKTVFANNMVDGVNSIGILMRDSLLVTGQSDVQKELDAIEEKRKVIKDNLDKLEKSVASESGKAALGKVLDTRTKYVAAQDQFIKLQKDGKQAEAKTYLLETAMGLQD
ncbi:MAG: MCP four helix bundle domain-containing protein, partial [Gallionellaceae bacterium]